MIRKLKINEKYSWFDTNNEYREDISDSGSINVWVDENGFEHNENGLASWIFYNGSTNKGIYSENFRKHGFLHNLFGPSIIVYDVSGKISEEEYYIDGIKLSKNNWELEINRINTLKEL